MTGIPVLRRPRRIALAAALALCAALPAAGQDAQTLADIRAELQALGAQLASLRQEMVATGASGGPLVAGSALDRMNAMEAELSALTAKTEQLELRINRVVQDGTNRLGDLEFRLCEIEPDCDLGSVGQTRPLGGDTGSAPVPRPGPATGGSSGGAELAMGEKADFDRAREVLDQGDFRRAADLLAAFTETYPGSPLTGEANYYRGEALMGAGDTAGAARAWLASFSGYPDGPRAPDALLKLGQALGQLGQVPEACVTLGEVPSRYPASPAAQEAVSARARLGCG